MKTHRPALFTAARIAVASILSFSGSSAVAEDYQESAGYGGSRLDTFYERGDAMSERVSGFMRRIFKGSPQNSAPPNTNYAPPPSYQTPPASSRSASPPPPVSDYERPATNSSNKVYGYSEPPAKTTKKSVLNSSYSALGGASEQRTATKPVQAATRKKSERKPLINLNNSKAPTVESSPDRNGSYTPPLPSEPKLQRTPKTPEAEAPPAPKKTPAVEEQVASLNSVMPKEPAPTQPAPEPPKTIEKPIPEPTATLSKDDTPLGTKGSKPGRVKSPFAPYNELDVDGLESGSMALDPTTNKVFKVP